MYVITPSQIMEGYRSTIYIHYSPSLFFQWKPLKSLFLKSGQEDPVDTFVGALRNYNRYLLDRILTFYSQLILQKFGARYSILRLFP